MEAQPDERVEIATAAKASTTRPPRVFEPTLSGAGVVVGLFFMALSLQPSLLPRAGYVQGIASGVTFMVGYEIGAVAQAVWAYLRIPTLRGRARTIVVGLLLALIVWGALFSAWRQVGWQNEIRSAFGMTPVSWTAWPVILAVGVAMAALLLVVSRALRLLFRTVGQWLGSWMPRRAAIALGATALALLARGLVTAVVVTGFFAVSNAIFSTRDGATTPGVVQTQSPLR